MIHLIIAIASGKGQLTRMGYGWILFGALTVLACGTESVVKQTGGTGGGGGTGSESRSGGSSAIIRPIIDGGIIDARGSGATVDPNCKKISCFNDAGTYCGLIGDGCHGQLNCGDCPADQVCGAIAANVCSPPPDKCTPLKCEQEGGRYCGKIGDGCGRLLDCGDCTGGLTCGGGGTASVCGAPTDSGLCTSYTCSSTGTDYCGTIGNGCGGSLDCGACPNGKLCHATAKICAAPCDLCEELPRCDAGPTTITGKVFTGAQHNPDPVPNVLVFIPNGTLPTLMDGAHCDRCTALTIDQAIASTLTAPDGSFTLSGVPAGDEIPIVIQLGGWRRRTTVKVNPCTSNAVADGTLRLPRSQNEGDIPLTAVVTGQYDALECVLRKMGVDDAEFTGPKGAGRIHMFKNSGATVSGSGKESDLSGSADTMRKYNQILLPCATTQTPAAGPLANLVKYTDAGGRAFLTDLNYAWLYKNGPFAGAVTWSNSPGVDSMGPSSGVIDTSFAQGSEFAAWLKTVGALSQTTPPTIAIEESYVRALSIPPDGGAQAWITSATPKSVQHFTINTPVKAPPDQLCGRVVYSAFHVTDALGSLYSSTSFPDSCGPSLELSAQEKVLEFMILDLASCIRPNGDAPPPPPPPPPPALPPVSPPLVEKCSPTGGACIRDVDCCSGAGQCVSNVCTRIIIF